MTRRFVRKIPDIDTNLNRLDERTKRVHPMLEGFCRRLIAGDHLEVHDAVVMRVGQRIPEVGATKFQSSWDWLKRVRNCPEVLLAHHERQQIEREALGWVRGQIVA